jgi:hypothetical protein
MGKTKRDSKYFSLELADSRDVEQLNQEKRKGRDVQQQLGLADTASGLAVYSLALLGWR